MVKGAGIILAGGKAVRLGGVSKANIVIGGVSCLARTRRVLGQSLNDLALSSPEDARLDTELENIADWPDDGRGGVAFAVLGALSWARSRSYDFIITAPVDTPFLPLSFTSDLIDKAQSGAAPLTFKHNQRIQGLHALWPCACFDKMKALILEQGECKIGALHKSLGSQILQLPPTDFDPFLNLNTEADIKAAQDMARIHHI